MCGITGYTCVKVFDGRFFTAFPLMGLFMQNRGSDAWGWTDGDEIVKGVGPFSKGVSYSLYGYKEAAFHTRHATQGAKEKQENAHPFHIGSIVGMHNGIIYNHDEMNTEYARDYQVDSMHIFAHLDAGLDISELRGYGAVCFWHKGKIHLGRFNGGELAVVHIPDVGWAWASTRSALETSLGMSGFDETPLTWLRLKEDRCYVLDGHNIKKSDTFKLNIGNSSYSKSYLGQSTLRYDEDYYPGGHYSGGIGYRPQNGTTFVKGNSHGPYSGHDGRSYGINYGINRGPKLVDVSGKEIGNEADKEEHTRPPMVMSLEAQAYQKTLRAFSTGPNTAKATPVSTLDECRECHEPLKDGEVYCTDAFDDAVCGKCSMALMRDESTRDNIINGPFVVDLDVNVYWVSDLVEQCEIYCCLCGELQADNEKVYQVCKDGELCCSQCYFDDLATAAPVGDSIRLGSGDELRDLAQDDAMADALLAERMDRALAEDAGITFPGDDDGLVN